MGSSLTPYYTLLITITDTATVLVSLLIITYFILSYLYYYLLLRSIDAATYFLHIFICTYL